jgi:death-on-curing protein
MIIRYLTREELETINKFLALKYGFKHVVIKPGMLDLCVESPKRKVFGQEVHPGKIEKAAVLMKEINKLHPFLSGTKRTAYVAAETFLELNGYRMSAETDAAVDISIKTAACSVDTYDILDWMKECCTRSPWHSVE